MVDAAPVSLGDRQVCLLLHAELEKRVPDLRDRGEAVGGECRRDRFKLGQGLVRLAGGRQGRGRAGARGKRRGVLAEHATVDVELGIELVELGMALAEVEVDLPHEIG